MSTPGDVQGCTRVVQWCFAAVSTVEPTLVCIDMIEIFDSDKAAHEVERLGVSVDDIR